MGWDVAGADHAGAARAALRCSIAMCPSRVPLAAVAAVLIHSACAAETATEQFAALAQLPPSELASMAARRIVVTVDLDAGPGLAVEAAGERATVRYRMAFNQVAEGWSWRPLADPAVDDYYRYKFLPLQSVAVERGEYAHEDKIGVTQQMKVVWRYDYFLAFANLEDFYPRTIDDDAGFTADLPAAVVGRLRIRATARLVEPVLSESTTFWKATYGNPVDFTLKKRYFVAVLEQVEFVDSGRDTTLCAITLGRDRCTGD